MEHFTLILGTSCFWILTSLPINGMQCSIYILLWGASGKRWRAEAKVQKRKYRNWSMKVRRKVAYQCLVPYWLKTWCVEGLVAKGWLYPCNLRAGSWALRLHRALLSLSMWLPVWVTRPKTNSDSANHADPMLLSSCDSDADASVVIVSRWESSPIAQPVTTPRDTSK